MHSVTARVRQARQPPLRDYIGAAGFFIFGLAFHVAGFHAYFSGDPTPGPLWWRLTALAVACVAILVRGRAPVLGVGIALVAIGGEVPQGSLSFPVILIVGDLLYHAVLHTGPRTSRLLVRTAAAATLPLVATGAYLAPDWRAAVLLLVTLAAIPGIPVWWAVEVREQRDNAEAQRERTEQVTRIAELDRHAAVAAERSRMARDLHDVVAGHLSAIAIQSEAVLSVHEVAGDDPDTVREVLRSIRENSVESLTEMRAMIDLLRTDDGSSSDPHTAPARLRDLDPLLESARAGGLQVALRTNLDQAADPSREPEDATGDPYHAGTGEKLSAAVDLTAYRIVQEALTNVTRHAPGARVEVTLHRAGRQLTVEVTDGGAAVPAVAPMGGREDEAWGGTERIGTAEPDHSGIGLASMRERAQAMGGSFSAGPFQDGWRVQAVLLAGGEHT